MPELSEHQSGTASSRATAWLSPALAVPVVLGAGLGLLGGWCWWSWWGPAPDGKIYDTAAGPTWYPNPFDPGVTRDFSGTATYVVVGFGLALLLGAFGAWWSRHRAVAGLVAVLLGSVAAGALMTIVGLSQSPPDPQEKADSVKIGTELPGHLELAHARIGLPEAVAEAVHDDDEAVHLTTPYLVWPVGAMVGYFVVMVSILTTPEQLEPKRAPDLEPTA